mmetsp:Transcript_19155/g.28502  ORF Transcript_19155/g.28502 Transcript_19155/m.28502 type:complete len:238 (+) Transcript_19155:99-812(+)
MASRFSQQTSFTGLPQAQQQENLDFLGPNVPKEITKMVSLLDKIKQNHFRSIIQFTINYLKGDQATSSNTSPQTDTEQLAFQKLFNALKADGYESLTGQTLTALFSGVFVLFAASYRSFLPVKNFQAALNELRIPAALATDLTRSYQLTQEPMQNSLESSRLDLPCLDEFKWRVDVTLSTSSLSRLAEPSLFMQMTLSDGSIQQFEMTTDSFHQLRYNVARVLKDMNDVEQAPILKL